MQTGSDTFSGSRTALITGASSGIGYELAMLFARDGYDLVLIGRSGEALQHACRALTSAYGIRVMPIAADLSRPDSAALVVDRLEQALIDVEVLVNNAGVGVYGAFTDTDLHAELTMIGLNVVSVTHLTKLLLRRMLAKGRGKILNVASTAAFQPGPLMAVYYATKSYVLSFSEALANELRGSGITVSVLCPGPTHTAFQERAGMQASRLFDWGAMESPSVAAIGYHGLMKNKTVIVPGLKNKLLAVAVRFGPRGWVAALVRNMQERKSIPAADSNPR